MARATISDRAGAGMTSRHDGDSPYFSEDAATHRGCVSVEKHFRDTSVIRGLFLGASQGFSLPLERPDVRTQVVATRNSPNLQKELLHVDP
jgi:hypothetical protein